ncbi:MAG: ATP-binding protein [Thermodesulfobacteriota bacterium]
MAEEKERLLVTLRSIGDGVITTDVEGRVVLVNQVAEQLTGWHQDEAVGRPLSTVFHSIDARTRRRRVNPAIRLLSQGRVANVRRNTLLVCRNGGEWNIAYSGAPIRDGRGRIIGSVLVFRDETESQRLEQEVLKSQKLEALGVLAGGIAHDFNNILTAIVGNIALASYSLGQDPATPAAPLLEQAAVACQRAKKLVQQLLTFSRGGSPVRKSAAIGEVIRETAEFLLLGSRITCRYHFADDLWMADIDADQISQVIQNLVLNAKQAMGDGGEIDIGCRNIEVGEDSGPPLRPGGYIEVTVTDRGSGIPPERLPRIFDPYFTTKEDGSGLGLAVVHSIIRKHDGHIEVRSTVGAGTTFRFFVPAAGNGAAEPAAPAPRPAAGAGRVLIMDDDAMVGPVVHGVLSYLGYATTLVDDGRAAVDQYLTARESGAPYDAVILDLTVPGGMGGDEAVRQLLHHDPRVRVLAATGNGRDPILGNYREHGFAGVLIKPFHPDELVEALQKLVS